MSVLLIEASVSHFSHQISSVYMESIVTYKWSMVKLLEVIYNNGNVQSHFTLFRWWAQPAILNIQMYSRNYHDFGVLIALIIAA